VLSVILTAVLARRLGAVEFGIYYLVVAVSTFAYVIVDWGQSAYLVRESARRREDGDKLLGGALTFARRRGLCGRAGDAGAGEGHWVRQQD